MEKYCQKMKGRIKRGNNKNWGYCGYYENKITGKQNFLRSTKEYIIARYLESRNLKFETEMIIYEVGGISYKPDFFVFDKNNKLRLIIEAKDNLTEYEEYKEKFTKFFSMLKIRYVVIYDFKKIIRKLNLTEDIQKWKDDSILKYDKLGFAGELNPRYGTKATDETKEKIGNKTRERMQDPEWKRKWRKGVKKAMERNMDDPSWREKWKEKMIEGKKGLSERCRETRYCLWCGKEMYVRKSKPERTCSVSCGSRLAYKEGKIIPRKGKGANTKTYVRRLIGIGRLVLQEKEFTNYETFFKAFDKMRKEGRIYKHVGVSEETINKFFGDFAMFLQKVKGE